MEVSWLSAGDYLPQTHSVEVLARYVEYHFPSDRFRIAFGFIDSCDLNHTDYWLQGLDVEEPCEEPVTDVIDLSVRLLEI